MAYGGRVAEEIVSARTASPPARLANPASDEDRAQLRLPVGAERRDRPNPRRRQRAGNLPRTRDPESPRGVRADGANRGSRGHTRNHDRVQSRPRPCSPRICRCCTRSRRLCSIAKRSLAKKSRCSTAARHSRRWRRARRRARCPRRTGADAAPKPARPPLFGGPRLRLRKANYDSCSRTSPQQLQRRG